MNIPIYNEKHAILVQRVIFAFGGSWASGSREVQRHMYNATMFHLPRSQFTWSEMTAAECDPDSILHLGEDECLRLLELMET